MSPIKPPIRFYKEFFERDWDALGEHEQEALTDFLKHLQENPNDPQILASAERKGSYYAYVFRPGWIVYWSLAETEPASMSLLKGSEVKFINILDVKSLKDL
jgi:hypothetical protein